MEEYATTTIIISNKRRTRFYPIQLLPNFFCQIDFDNDQLLSISYYPLSQEYRMQEALMYRNELADLKTDIIIAAQKGIFQGTEEMGDYIRKYRALDPVLGLFAAYAYFQKGIY